MSIENSYFDQLPGNTSGVDELEKNVLAYPFSPVSNFLLLRHYKKNGHEQYEKFSKKAALYFNNNHWLQFQLSQIKDEPTALNFNNKDAAPEKNNINQDHFAVTTTDETTDQSISEIVTTEEIFIPVFDTDKRVKNLENSVVENSQEAAAEKINQRPVKAQDIEEQFEPIAFEPLHTVDYFASQGIKIPDEALSNDKLGTQMKSFTEWLKSMKRLHSGKLPEQNSLSENIVQSAAEISNIDTEVLTEAMAEVLIKQNKKEKAIEMYDKLSLINPSKSAYFAAKIERIKSL